MFLSTLLCRIGVASNSLFNVSFESLQLSVIAVSNTSCESGHCACE
jgi:hypothetical protein